MGLEFHVLDPALFKLFIISDLSFFYLCVACNTVQCVESVISLEGLNQKHVFAVQCFHVPGELLGPRP